MSRVSWHFLALHSQSETTHSNHKCKLSGCGATPPLPLQFDSIRMLPCSFFALNASTEYTMQFRGNSAGHNCHQQRPSSPSLLPRSAARIVAQWCFLQASRPTGTNWKNSWLTINIININEPVAICKKCQDMPRCFAMICFTASWTVILSLHKMKIQSWFWQTNTWIQMKKPQGASGKHSTWQQQESKQGNGSSV